MNYNYNISITFRTCNKLFKRIVQKTIYLGSQDVNSQITTHELQKVSSPQVHYNYYIYDI